MTQTKELTIVSAVPTGRGILVAFANGTEAFLDASLVWSLVNDGRALLLSDSEEERPEQPPVNLSETA